MYISDDRLTKALHYLSTSDSEIAQKKADVAKSEYVAKLREYGIFKTASGNIEERKAIAKTDAAVVAAWDSHFSAVEAYEKVRAKREFEALVVDVYRTTEASRRAGQI